MLEGRVCKERGEGKMEKSEWGVREEEEGEGRDRKKGRGQVEGEGCGWEER